MSHYSLRAKINKQALHTVIAVGIATIAGIFTVLYVKSLVYRDSVAGSLLRSAPSQVSTLLPSFLLEEQVGGVALILNHIKDDEGLEDAVIIFSPKQLPDDLTDCELTTKKFCVGKSGKLIATVSSITESEKNFGFLVKIKKIDSFLESHQGLMMIEVLVLTLILISVILFARITRVTAKEVPQALEDLVLWVEETASEKSEVSQPDFRFEEFNELAVKIARVISDKQSARDQAKLGALAAQVSHDIRSPLSALNMVLGSLEGLSEEKRLVVRNATRRINDIANSLLHQTKPAPASSTQSIQAIANESSLEPIMLVALLDAIVSEKRVQYRANMNVEIQEELSSGYGLFAKLSATEFSRAISNLINNSVEAMDGKGRVSIAVHGDNKFVTVTVQDNGKGIPSKVLSRLGERGVSYGKQGETSGSGLGLHHAREVVEEAGGRLAISSQFSKGTTVTITLPRADTPDWFLEAINVTSDAILVSIDDDQTIHQIWTERLHSLAPGHSVKHLSFSSLAIFESWRANNDLANAVFLVDYEFVGQSGNGLVLIERAGIAGSAILVTSRYEEPAVRETAQKLKVKILPKTLAPFVPLKLNQARRRYDAVLIDDDVELVHTMWRLEALSRGKKLLCFPDDESFFAKAETIAPESPLYIDVNLGSNVRGENVAARALGFGFKNISLTTGYEPDSLNIPFGVSRVIGKEPVF